MLRGTDARNTPRLWQGGRCLVCSLACLLIAVAQASAAEEVQQEVAAHLAAGELGLAREAALAAPAHLRDDLLQQVLQAQIEVGEFDLARVTLKAIEGQAGRQQLAGAIAEPQALAGGVVIDFQAIIDLIQNQTSGEWMDIDGFGGEADPFQAGVRVDPLGRLSLISRTDRTGRVESLARQGRIADLNDDMARTSALRMVSLTRLEREIAARLERGEPVVESMRQLAGLSEVRYVFFYPEEQEIVIAGPAEGWKYNEQGQPVGVTSGRPTLQLDDLVTLFRVFSPEGARIFGCSIDPRPEGLQELQQRVAASQNRGPLPLGQVSRWVRELGQTLGPQDISIQGVPVDSRVARVIVEADYKMKLIGIDRLSGGPHIPSYFDLLAGQPQASSAIEGLRWWLTLNYDEVLHSPDRRAFELGGTVVLCQSENEFLTDQGVRVQTGQAEPLNRLFASRFTQHYADLASREPVFADLQGVFNLALVAALIHREGVADWAGTHFAASGAYAPVRYWTPRETDTVANHRVYNGRDIVVQVAGGVKADILGALARAESNQADPQLTKLSQTVSAPELPEGRWWWDAPAAE